MTFTGKITFASGKNLSVNLQSGTGAHGIDNIQVTGAQLKASGSGTIDLECSQSVAISGGAVVQTQDGNLTVMANQQATATAGNFNGVNLDGPGTMLDVTGNGGLIVNGRGGDAAGGSQLGVNVNGGAQIIGSGGGAREVKVTGTGGDSAGTVNRGVTVYGAGSSITSAGARVNVNGTAGTKGSGFGIGISVLYGGKISSGGGLGTIITGTGGGGTSGGANHGVEIGGAVTGATPVSTITSPSNVAVIGTSGPGASSGLYMTDSATITIPPSSGAAISISADSISLDSSARLSAPKAQSFVDISSTSNIDLGGANAPGTIGLPPAELAQITTPSLEFDAPAITISAPITFSSATSIYLYPGTAGVLATAAGTDLNLNGGSLFINGAPLDMPITGPNADASPGYPQLNIVGGLGLGVNGAVPLSLTGTTYAGAAGQQFTIIKNGNTSVISGTFQNLPEGATFAWPAPNSSLITTITYKGGSSGRDVVLTLSATTPSPTPSPTPTSTPTATPTSTPTATPTATPTSTPTSTPTPTPTATPSSTPGLVGNVSTRLPVGTGDNVLIEGFIVQGPAGSTKKIIVRAIGPSLAPFGITDALLNPSLEIHDASGATIATNDNWKTTQVGGIIAADQAAEISASQLAPSNDSESAIIANLAPGSYTAIVSGVNNTIGTGVVDAYDISPSSLAKLANIATRGLIQPGDKLMIAGFIVQNAPVQTVVRAIGPSLVPFGIPNALPDTTLQLRDQNGTIVVQNDDWKVRTDGSSQQAELEATGLQPTNDLEAAVLITLPPGQYTAQVRGKPEQTGIGVVQVYFLP
ncbi:MAG: hypothetical protein QOE26_1860 [Verrucomicrobiota bacterium]